MCVTLSNLESRVQNTSELDSFQKSPLYLVSTHLPQNRVLPGLSTNCQWVSPSYLILTLPLHQEVLVEHMSLPSFFYPTVWFYPTPA